MFVPALISVISAVSAYKAGSARQLSARRTAALDHMWLQMELQQLYAAQSALLDYTTFLSLCLENERALTTWH